MAEKRYPIRKKRRLRVRFGKDEPTRFAFTGDASDEGMYIITAQPERPGTNVQIELNLPDGQQVIAVGLVCWAKKVPANLLRLANKAGMGVRLTEFISGEDDYKDYLESLRH
ncbi:MAG: pilus assembly protein PilZ [Desulfuromonas sp.]|nr:MAG: pilus assembly protein PilZ [Desulfuromonas sp.]